MAFGTDTSASGGVVSFGNSTAADDLWAALSGIDPSSPLVGGSVGAPRYGQTGAGMEAIVTQPSKTAAQVSGTARKHWSGAFDFKNNPLSWLLLLCLILWAGHKLPDIRRRRS